MKVLRAPFGANNGGLKFVFRSMSSELWQGRNDDGVSSVSWRRTRKFSTAAMASETAMSGGSRKRLSRNERRVMVESFVNRYRAQNAGKFPNISVTQKEVGGSYYVIRNIIQELEYASKCNPLDETYKNLSVGDTDTENKTTPKVEFPGNEIVAEEVSCSHRTIEVSHNQKVEMKDMPILGVKTETVVEKSADAELQRQSTENQEASSQPSLEGLTGLPPGDVSTIQEMLNAEPQKDDKFRSTTSHVPAEGDRSVSHAQEQVLLDEKDEKFPQDPLKPCISSLKQLDDKVSSGVDGSLRDSSLKTTDEVGAKKKPSSSLWSNLKSFAGSIISILKKHGFVSRT